MALKDVFKRKTPLEKASKELMEKFAQPEHRRAAMAKLIEIGTPEAHAALLKRFTFSCNGHIADEDEKRDLVEEIVRIRQPMIEPIRTFLKTEKAVEFPLRALRRIMGKEEVGRFLLEILESMEPLDHRTIEQKRGLISALADLGQAEAALKIAPYLHDHSDDVQFQAVEALESLNVPEASRAIVEVCVGETHAARIQRRAAQALMKLEISVRDRFDELNDELRQEYYLGKKGVLVRKTGAQASNA